MEASEGFTIVFGASGAGKTTLLNCIAGISRPDSGRIVVSGTVFFDAEKRFSLPVAQRRVGYVFQDLALFPHLTAEQNISYASRSWIGKIRRLVQMPSCLPSPPI